MEAVVVAGGLTFVLTRLLQFGGCPVCDLSAIRHHDVRGGTDPADVTS
jgi:hypothetical protein